MHRPEDWNIPERRVKKLRKKRRWGTKGGYISPITVPSTPGGELLKVMRKVDKNEEPKVENCRKGRNNGEMGPSENKTNRNWWVSEWRLSSMKRIKWEGMALQKI